MLTSGKLFGNNFDSRKITNTRLANFAEDSLNRFKDIAIEGQFATTIAELTVALDNLRKELGDVKSAKDARKTKTLRVDEFIKLFKNTMSELEGVIAYTTGGFNSDAYRAFYPNGVSEYRNATKTNMAEQITSVKNALTTFDAALSADLKTKLNGFYTQWHTLRNQQETAKSKVTDNRTERTDARKEMEMALHKAVATVNLEFPLEEDKCARFFDFNMLYPVKHHEKEEEEDAEVEETEEA